MDDARKRSNRLQLVALFGIAGLTLAGASALFYTARSDGVWGTVNHGEFVQPPLTLAALNIEDSNGRALTSGETWWLWVVARESCDSGCADAVLQLRQLHVLLAKDAARVQRGLVTPRGAPAPAVLADFPKLQHLQGELETLKTGVYVVDPIGNLVFWYPLSDAGKPVLEDLKRLLKLSQIG